MNPIETLVAKWAEPNGIPYKGELISKDGCMCAQGQALHYIGGMSADQLRNIAQEDADGETSRLLGISRAHAVLLRQVNDGQPGAPSVVLTDPAKVLGDQAETVLAFWRHLDRMTPKQWAAAGAAAWDAAWAAAAGAAARDAARDAAGDAARDAAWAAADGDADGDAAWDAAWAAARDAAWATAKPAAWATNEIQGAAIMRAKGQPFYFLPMFGFADPEAVLAADASAGDLTNG